MESPAGRVMSQAEKMRRMQLRRDIGNRAAPRLTPETSGARYLIAHACFDCRKSFKTTRRDDESAICPECGGALNLMGRSFRTPPAREKSQWMKIRLLYEAGFRFFSFRSGDGPPLPAKLAQVEAFIRENPQHPLRVSASHPCDQKHE